MEYYGSEMTVSIDATEPPVVVLNTIIANIVSDRRNETEFTENPSG